MSSPYRTELQPDATILYVEVGRDYVVHLHQDDLLRQTVALLDSAQQPLYVILDLQVQKITMEDVIHGVNASSRGDGNLFHHPNLAQGICVTTSDVLRMAIKGMNSPIFGNVKVPVFATADEAFAYAREQVAVSTR